MITHNMTLDMTPIPGRKLQEICLSQGDADFQLCATLFSNHGELTIESGTSVTIRGTKPDGTAYTKDVALEGNTVTVQGDADLTDAAGMGVFEFCLNHNGRELHSPNFVVLIEPRTVG